MTAPSESSCLCGPGPLCPYCDRVSNFGEHVDEHGEAEFECVHCGQTFEVVDLRLRSGRQDGDGSHMTVPSEHSCLCSPEPLCPYCGEPQSDFWEHNGEDGEVECGHCERVFMWSRYVEVSYSTEPIIGPHRLSQYTIDNEALED